MEDDARDERDNERTEKLMVLLVADHLAHALLGVLDLAPDLDAEGGGPYALNLLPAERAVGNLRRAHGAQADVPARN